MAKISKTYTIEEETFKIIKNNKDNKNLSSYSASLERIILEWNIINKVNNYNLNINEIVDEVIKKLDITKNNHNKENQFYEQNDYNNSIQNVLNDIPF